MTSLSHFRLIRDVPARFWSEAPLFDFSEGVRPLASGRYRATEDSSTIVFAFHEDHYRVSGDATPETVVLIPLRSPPGTWLFQQSTGYGVTFYGALRLTRPGFEIFSPESSGLEAVDLATGHGALPSEQGCQFGDPDMLILTLLPLLATPEGWTRYLPIASTRTL